MSRNATNRAILTRPSGWPKPSLLAHASRAGRQRMSDHQQGWVPQGFVQETRQAISDLKHALSDAGDHRHHHDEQFEHVYDALRALAERVTELENQPQPSTDSSGHDFVSDAIVLRILLLSVMLLLNAGKTIPEVIDEVAAMTFFDKIEFAELRQDLTRAHERACDWLREGFAPYFQGSEA